MTAIIGEKYVRLFALLSITYLAQLSYITLLARTACINSHVITRSVTIGAIAAN